MHVGSLVETMEGFSVAVGREVGLELGLLVGTVEGFLEGKVDGIIVGKTEGLLDGGIVRLLVGKYDEGVMMVNGDGSFVGFREGGNDRIALEGGNADDDGIFDGGLLVNDFDGIMLLGEVAFVGEEEGRTELSDNTTEITANNSSINLKMNIFLE